MLPGFRLNKEAFSKRFRQLFKASGFKQADLAEAIDVTQASVSAWLNGKKMPGFGEVVRIATAFKIDLSEFGKEATEDVPVAARGRRGKPAPID